MHPTSNGLYGFPGDRNIGHCCNRSPNTCMLYLLVVWLMVKDMDDLLISMVHKSRGLFESYRDGRYPESDVVISDVERTVQREEFEGAENTHGRVVYAYR